MQKLEGVIRVEQSVNMLGFGPYPSSEACRGPAPTFTHVYPNKELSNGGSQRSGPETDPVKSVNVKHSVVVQLRVPVLPSLL